MSLNTWLGRHAWALRCRFDRDTDPSNAASSIQPRLRPAVAAMVDAYRRSGHRQARLDPLDHPAPVDDPRLGFESFGLGAADDVTEDGTPFLGTSRVDELQQRLRALYCGTLAVDLSAMRDETARRWMQDHLESTPPSPLVATRAQALLHRLARVQGWERHLARRFPDGKRFSLEGCEALIPLLDAVFAAAAGQGLDEVVMGMPHRGRVNVLATLLGHPVDALLDFFEDEPAHPERQRDLVYHLGGDYRVQTPAGPLRVTLASNPSHLQSVYPVVAGMTRARRRAAAGGAERCMAVVMHGDAAFTGQGVVMETLAMGLRPGYEVGGVVHIVINNQLGFTEPNRMSETRQRTCTDPTRMVDAPVIRVNADDPEAVLRAAQLAMAYRARFGLDVVIDLIGFRRLGHSEHDVPMLTSPSVYRQLARKSGVVALYGERLATEGRLDRGAAAACIQMGDDFDTDTTAGVCLPVTPAAALPPFTGAVAAFEPHRLKQILAAITDLPADFEAHAMLRAHAARRQAMAEDSRAPVDWCAAETLAWAAVLEEGRSIRLSGLDVQRGTFMHRQAVWHNQSPAGPATWLPLQALTTDSARLEIHNSVLSEEAVLGYEYGHSVQSPGDVTVWEAQFGDFVNGAQVYLDQYISSGEEKWGVASALTVLLPHGYEGVGPEHSNGFLSRMLQLCGADNVRVACPSTSGQYAHLLIRQALDPVRKPLIVMTPKGTMMSEPMSHTAIGALAAAAFQPVLDDDTVPDREAVTRVVLCSGKVAYDLLTARDAGVDRGRTAIVRLEQLYPFPAVELVDVLARYPSVRSLVWTQEETRHQGAWAFIRDELEALCPPGASLSKVARAMTAAGATASLVIHRQQQRELAERALMA